MLSFIDAVEQSRRRGQMPARGPVSVKYLMQHFQPSPLGSMKALMLKMLTFDDGAFPFCGTPDPNRDGTVHPLTFGSPGGRWNRTSLSYSINPAGCRGLQAQETVETIKKAFALWATVLPFFMLQPVMTDADIRVAFGGPNEDERFGTRGGVVGVGKYPEAGQLFLDSVEDWTVESLLVVTAHEIGHVLGLKHSTSRASIMYPYALSQMIFQARLGRLSVEAESVDALRQMYGWSPQTVLDNRGTTHRPALAIMGESDLSSAFYKLHMVWRGVSGDSRIYWSQLNGNDWTPQNHIEGIGSSHSPSLTSIPIPAVDRVRQGLFMAWKGARDDENLYWSRNFGRDWGFQSRVEGVGSSCGPGVAYFNEQVYMAWKGVADDSGIYWSTFDGERWAPQRRILGIGTSDCPALAVLGNQLHMFWKGVHGDANAYFSTLDGGEGAIWQPQRLISYVETQTEGMVSVPIGTEGALSACLRGNRILLAWKGVQGDSSIYFSSFDGQEFTGQMWLNNAGTSVGPTVFDFEGQTHILWKGVVGDSNIYWSRL
jgi:hypothetical protein